MTAITAKATRSWTATHRLLLIVVGLAIAFAAAATVAIVAFTSSGSSSTVDRSAPTVERELTPTQQACELARVVGC